MCHGRKQAENLANWSKKGMLIGITGRIQTRNYENQQGQRVYVTEVVADGFKILENVIMPRTSRAWKVKCHQDLKIVILRILKSQTCHFRR